MVLVVFWRTETHFLRNMGYIMHRSKVYRMPKKPCPSVYSEVTMKIERDFLDIQYKFRQYRSIVYIMPMSTIWMEILILSNFFALLKEIEIIFDILKYFFVQHDLRKRKGKRHNIWHHWWNVQIFSNAKEALFDYK